MVIYRYAFSLKVTMKFSEKRKREKEKKKAFKNKVQTSSPSQEEINNLLRLYNNDSLHIAEKLAVSIIEKYPRCIIALQALAGIYQKFKRNVEALDINKRVVSLIPNNSEAHYNLGNSYKSLNKNAQAIACFKKSVTISPKFSAAHFNLGNTLKIQKRFDDAVLSFRRAININPDFAEAHFNIGNIFKAQEKLDDAVTSYIRAIDIRPDLAPALSNLGTTLKSLGQLDDAEKYCRKAIRVDSSNADFHFNLGSALKEKKLLKDAIKSFESALKLRPDFPEAHFHLGNSLRADDRLEKAVLSFRQAIAIKPAFIEAYSNLGNTLMELDSRDCAIAEYVNAICLNANLDYLYVNLGIALRNYKLSKPLANLEIALFNLLDRENLAKPIDLAEATISLLKSDSLLTSAIRKKSSCNAGSLRSDFISALSDCPLLLKLMAVCPIPDLEFENLFRLLRAEILEYLGTLNDEPKILGFQIALALQCYINEYVYKKSDVEIKYLQNLETSVEQKLNCGTQPSSAELLCLSSYKSLSEYLWITKVQFSEEIQPVLLQQITECEQEKRIKSDMARFETITNRVSTEVQGQYEENPYPKWINMGVPLSSISISELVKVAQLDLIDSDITKTVSPKILIAGCGTGQHSIATASRFSLSKVLAIDLSLSSLAYAQRKTNDLRVSNIEYLQCDILNIADLNQNFHIIESSGVLHHMDDPMAGWGSLTRCLNPGGLMKIGLYSDLARQDVAKVRDEVQILDIEDDLEAMRSFRTQLAKSDKPHHKRIAMSQDFYSLSSFRDLIFHKKEHRFNLPQIQKHLDDLGLHFCGFENLELLKMFRNIFPEESALYDLKAWAIFEEGNPTIFSGMYQFWCQKI